MNLNLRLLHLVPSLLMLSALSACSTLSSLNPFSKPDTKNMPAVLQDFTASMHVKQKWMQNIGSAGEYVFVPAVVGQDIYVASQDGSVLKLAAQTGQVQWRIKASLPLTAGVGANAKAVVVAGQKGKIFVYDTQGRLSWEVQASSEILSTPAVSDELVLVHSIDNRITAYKLSNGERQWTVERPLPVLTLRIVTGISLKDQVAVISSPGGKLFALALQNGGMRWEASAADPKGSTELERIVDMAGAPAIVGNNACAVTYQGRVACFDLETGSTRWAKNISSEVGVAADERFVFAADNQGGLFAYAMSGGASAWKNDQLSFRQLSTPTSFGRAVVLGDGFGYVHFVSREDGAFLARLATDGGKIMSAPLVLGNDLIVQTKTGAVVAIATE